MCSVTRTGTKVMRVSRIEVVCRSRRAVEVRENTRTKMKSPDALAGAWKRWAPHHVVRALGERYLMLPRTRSRAYVCTHETIEPLLRRQQSIQYETNFAYISSPGQYSHFMT
ncbi:unnamed protein product [Sphacelaria rigidula]